MVVDFDRWSRTRSQPSSRGPIEGGVLLPPSRLLRRFDILTARQPGRDSDEGNGRRRPASIHGRAACG
jgi:hypothetical protein